MNPAHPESRLNPPPPWHLICKEAIRGHSLQSLSLRYGVSVENIQKHLDRALDLSDIAQGVRIRSNAEIKHASDKARNDLVSFLLDAIDELRASNQPKLDQLQPFQTLLACAARLFVWPSVSISKQSGSHLPSPDASAAVNLALIATPPEQLAKLALSHVLDQQPSQASHADQPVLPKTSPP